MAPKRLPSTIGRYQILDRLGTGGMGVVYRGLDPKINRQVAIKVLRGAADEDYEDRFLQEARSAGGLSHPNIVTIFDFGEHAGEPFIVMEFVEGETLASVIREGRPMALARKLELMEEVARALAYAHNRGVIHRDIKPANLMVDRGGVVKILDFGIARVGASNLTQVGAILGTPNYMSPEQVTGQPVDRRSDIFAVGLVLYELLSYRRAFSGQTWHEICSAVVSLSPVPLEELFPHLPPALEAIVGRAIAKEPAERYQDLAEMATDLARSRRDLDPQFNESTVKMPAPAPMPTTPRIGPDRQRLQKRRTERIAELLETAERALRAGDAAAAAEAGEHAALLDSEDPRVADVLERAARLAGEIQIDGWLRQGRDALERGALDEAAQLAARAIEIDGMSTAARAFEDAVADHRRREEARRERGALIERALDRARERLAADDPESAIRAASEVLIHEPAHTEAHRLTRIAAEVMEARRVREQQEREARAFVQQQRRLFEAGSHQEAIDALAGREPALPVVTGALSELRAAAAEIARVRREAEEARRREEEAAERRRQARLQWKAGQVATARAAVETHRFVDAITVLEHVQATEGAEGEAPSQEVVELLERAREGETRAQARMQRERDVKEHVRQAMTARAAGRLDDALRSVDAALALIPGSAAAAAERQAIEAAQAAVLERQAREDAARRAREEAEQRAREDAEQRAREEAARRAREEAEQRAREEAEQRAREEAERRAREDAARRAREEADRRAREAAEQRAREEAKRRAREEAEQRAREEAEQRAREEAERRAHEAAASRKARARAEEERRRQTPALPPGGAETDDAPAPLSATRIVPPAAAAVAPLVGQPSPPAVEAPPVAQPRRSQVPAIGAVAAVLLVAVIGWWLFGRTGTPVPTAPVTSPASTAASGAPAPAVETPAPATPAAPPSEPPPSRPAAAASPEPTAAAGGEPAIDVAELQRRVADALRRENIPQALDAIARSSPAGAGAPAVKGTLDQVAAAARRRAAADLAAASAAPLVRDQADYLQAVTRNQAASDLLRQGRAVEAIQAWLSLRQLLASATARAAAAAPAAAPSTADRTALRTGPQAAVPPPVADAGTSRPAAPPPPPPSAETRPAPADAPPARPEAAPPPAPARSDVAAVDAVIDAWLAAYESLDAARIRAIWPGAPARLNFNDVRAYHVQLTDRKISVSGDTATVEGTREINAELSVGRSQRVKQRTTFRLRRSGSGWLIDRVQ